MRVNRRMQHMVPKVCNISSQKYALHVTKVCMLLGSSMHVLLGKADYKQNCTDIFVKY